MGLLDAASKLREGKKSRKTLPETKWKKRGMVSLHTRRRVKKAVKETKNHKNERPKPKPIPAKKREAHSKSIKTIRKRLEKHSKKRKHHQGLLDSIMARLHNAPAPKKEAHKPKDVKKITAERKEEPTKAETKRVAPPVKVKTAKPGIFSSLIKTKKAPAKKDVAVKKPEPKKDKPEIKEPEQKIPAVRFEEGTVHTELDEILAIIQKQGSVTLSALSSRTKLPLGVIESWCGKLAQKDLIKVDYPVFGKSFAFIPGGTKPKPAKRRGPLLIIFILLILAALAVIVIQLLGGTI